MSHEKEATTQPAAPGLDEQTPTAPASLEETCSAPGAPAGPARLRELEHALDKLARLLQREGFNAGRMQFRFVRLLEERANGEQVLLFERKLRHGLVGHVIVKRLRDPGTFQSRQRLEEQVQLAFRLRHPAIAQVHHFKVIGKVPHVIMEYVEGPTLESLLTAAALRDKPLPTAFALYVAAEVADALHHAHTLTGHAEGGGPLGLIHRDVSPRNIRVDRQSGQVKLTDFGAAFSRRVGREETPGHLLKGDLMYAAPEYLEGAALDARADLFSLGLVLLEALTQRHLLAFWLADVGTGTGAAALPPGMRPDEEPELPLQELRARAARYTSEDVERATEPLPEGLRALLRRVLRRAPAERHASAGELGEALRAELHALHPGYGRNEAAEDLARVLARANEWRELGEPLERGLLPSGLDGHELALGGEATPR
jgi:serine/threonine-protein kinase